VFSVRNALAAAAAVLAVVAGSTGAAAEPSVVAATCVNGGPFSFKSSVAPNYSTIYVYNGTGCSGSHISYGRATLSVMMSG
jgi:hypothetical protein